MKKIFKSPIVFLLECLALALFVEACGAAAPEEPSTGMNAVSSSGRWMTVLEPVQDAPSRVYVVDLKSGTRWLELPDADLYRQPITIFSPSGDYLLYGSNEMWQVVELSSQSIWTVAPTNTHVEFLYDDQILIVEKKEPIYEVSRRYPSQENPVLLTPSAHYIFQSYPRSTISSSWFADNAPDQVSCPPAPAAAADTHVIVDANGNAWVFAAGSYIRQLDNAPIKELFAEHESKQREFALQQLQQLQATPDSPAWTEEQKTSYIDSIVYDGISGLVSPDGKHLLVLTTVPENKYSLYLIDLDPDQVEAGIKHLSTESNWTPRFLFSPDASQILYESNHDGSRAWYLRRLNDSDPIRLKLQGAENLCWN